jgi:signal transduction histidine kinase
MFRALAVLRVLLLANTVALNIYRRDNFVHPTAGAVMTVVMAVWTFIAIWAYSAPRRRTPLLLGLDLGIALLMIALTPWVKGSGFNGTVPGFWVMGAMLAWAIHWRLVGGAIASVCVVSTDLLAREHITQSNYGNVFLLLIGGLVVGYLVDLLQRTAVARDRAEREAAVAGERARLARAVHDGVLQVLALAQRRGAEPGGDAELGRLAGEQEHALRSLIRRQDALQTPSEESAVDLAAVLEGLSALRPPRVNVAVPGTPVLLPAAEVGEVEAAVRACLDNVARHVGEDAPAWVFLEDLGDRIVVSVRDEGPGIPDGRLEQAEADGRLGVSGSIRGRVDDLGGTVELSTGSFGTEWELTLPRAVGAP